MAGPGTVRPRRLEAFAVEDTTVQLCWSRLGPGPVRLRIADVEVEVPAVDAARAGAVVLGPLAPGTEHALLVDGREALRFRTLAPPPGEALARVATVGDLHVGEVHFGHWPSIREDLSRPPLHSERCLAAALDEAVAWGADVVVVKGDLTARCRTEELDTVGRLLAALPVPVVVLPGNHDGGNHRGADAATVLAGHGIALTTGTAVVDLPGVRVVAANSMTPEKGHGSFTTALRDAVDALVGAPGGALLATHHHLQRTLVPLHWPPGIFGLDAHRLLRAVRRAHPDTLVTSGHSHRHRRRQAGPVVFSEVGSTKDYPGTWAGYVAYEGGISQVVRRVAEPEALAWTERTRTSVLGLWGRWSSGSLADRSFAHTWASVLSPARRAPRG